MSEQFQVGDSVEVLPCGSQHDHCIVTGRRGTVLVAAMDAGGVGVSFPGFCGNNLFGKITTNTGWFCAPAWLRHVQPSTRPRFKIGDWVVQGLEIGQVTHVRTEPRYDVETPRGVGEYIRESELRRHAVAPPIVCAPDGTRCAWMADTMHRLEAHTGYPIRNMVIVFPDGCPVCKGRF